MVFGQSITGLNEGMTTCCWSFGGHLGWVFAFLIRALMSDSHLKLGFHRLMFTLFITSSSLLSSSGGVVLFFFSFFFSDLRKVCGVVVRVGGGHRKGGEFCVRACEWLWDCYVPPIYFAFFFTFSFSFFFYWWWLVGGGGDKGAWWR
ncbi:hypothetical protein RND81_14G074600 [Saponaria officinalis]|uniref:Transmembrane protein n=1 Tax=Saponaria officinalis TaxID=3572 RepID=A0AAW1GRC8_SAPOF